MADEDLIATFRERHADLGAASSELVDAVSTMAASLEVAGEVDASAVARGLRASVETLRELDAVLGVASRAADGEVDAEAWYETVARLEPPPSLQEGEEPGADTDNVTPLRRLSAPYGVLLELEKTMYTERLKRPFRVRKLKEIWGDFERIGGSHPSEGLAARLNRFAEFADPSASTAGPPWRSEDRRAIRELAERAEAIGEWSDEELAAREREVWVERVQEWLGAAEDEAASPGRMAEIPRRLLTDLPAEKSPKVEELLERIAEIEALPSELRNRARNASGR